MEIGNGHSNLIRSSARQGSKPIGRRSIAHQTKKTPNSSICSHRKSDARQSRRCVPAMEPKKRPRANDPGKSLSPAMVRRSSCAASCFPKSRSQRFCPPSRSLQRRMTEGVGSIALDSTRVPAYGRDGALLASTEHCSWPARDTAGDARFRECIVCSPVSDSQRGERDSREERRDACRPRRARSRSLRRMLHRQMAVDQVAVVGNVAGGQAPEPLDVIAPAAARLAGNTEPLLSVFASRPSFDLASSQPIFGRPRASPRSRGRRTPRATPGA